MNAIEILGWVAMLLVSGSFLMKDVIKLRIINASGALCFVIYGLLISSFPVTALNIFVSAVNGYYIYKHYAEKKAKSQ